MGPEGGEGGGTMVTCGTPEEVAAVEKSYTGKYLKKYLNPDLPQAKRRPRRESNSRIARRIIGKNH